MAQKTEVKAEDHHTQNDHIGDDEVTELQRPNSIYAKVRKQAERFASTRLGQMVIERIDRGLKLIEDTTKWSLPQDKNSSVVLERPLSWIPFLLLIIVLRLVRAWVSIAAFLIGNGPISPLDMIYFIQTRRRKLRAIRVHGLKTMRNSQRAETGMTNGTTLSQKLSQWLSRANCQPGVRIAVSTVNVVKQEQNQLNKSVSSKRSRDEECEDVDQNLTIDEMLAKYANENSEDDSDFVPPEEKSSAESSSTSDLSDTDSHSSEEISSAEEEVMAKTLEEITPQMKIHQIKQMTTNGSNGINEKTEPVPAAQPNKALEVKEEDQWKSSPGHLSAALTKTQSYNTTAAAGSPNNFHSCLGTQALLKNAAIIAAPTHSTPNSEHDEIHTAGSDAEDPTMPSISLAYQAEQQDSQSSGKPFKQQQQHRQFNHSHQRFRGRNRR